MLLQDFNSVSGFTRDLKIYDSISFNYQHFHRGAELILMKRGELTLFIGSEEFTLRAGDCALILQYVPHSFVCTDAKFIVDVFAEQAAGEFFTHLSNRTSPNPIFRPRRVAVDYYESIYGLSDFDVVGDILTIPVELPSFTASAGLYAILSEFLSLCELEVSENCGFREKLFEYIRVHCHEPLRLERISADFGFEYHYFSKLVHRSTGMTLYSLITRFRVDMAKQLLMSKEHSVTEIAHLCGFGSLRCFDRCFAKAEGTSPAKYRQS